VGNIKMGMAFAKGWIAAATEAAAIFSLLSALLDAQISRLSLWMERHCKACNPDLCTLYEGACHHALGSHLDAVKDYTGAFSLNSSELGDDSRSRQFLTFYQREMALYARLHIDRPVEDYCLDHDLHPIFKASGYCLYCADFSWECVSEQHWALAGGS
jgi:hypothetical protein